MPPDNTNAQHIQGPGERTDRRIWSADRRESIWSVGEPWRWLYFTFFLLLMGAGSSLVGWDTLFGEGGSEGVVQLLLAAFMAQVAVSVASAGMSLGITEGRDAVDDVGAEVGRAEGADPARRAAGGPLGGAGRS